MYKRQIYRWAHQQLRLIDAEWEVIKISGKENDPDKIADIVEKVENTFQSERETWMEQVIQSNNIVENSLKDKYDRLQTEVKPTSG